MKRTQQSGSQRRGVVLMTVMVCAAVTGLVLASSIRTSYQRNRFLVGSYRQRQSEWLAHSGVERALAKLARDPKYSGEIWRVGEADLGGQGAGRVEIAVRSDSPTKRNLEVRARIPDSDAGALTTRQMTLTMP